MNKSNDSSQFHVSWRIAVVCCFILLSCESAWALNEPWSGAYSSGPFADGVIRNAFCDIASLIEGSFGSLLATVAGVFLVISAAFGNLKQSPAFIMTAVGAATITTGVAVYFGDFGCSAGSNSTQNQKTISSAWDESSSSDTKSQFRIFPSSEKETAEDQKTSTGSDPFDSF